MPKHLNTGTAADLIGFEDYIDSTGQSHISRVATANEEWIVSDWDGEQYCIRFDKNFSKKHLITFTKKLDKTATEAALISGQAGKQGRDAENWGEAEHAMLGNKVNKLLGHRAVSTTCNCGHAYNRHRCSVCNHLCNQHPLGGACNQGGCACGEFKAGPCNSGGCHCLQFKTPYGQARDAKNKPTSDPLAGASTARNTCIIMNYVPKSEFEAVVVRSIQALEKPPGWTKGQPLAKAVHDDVELRWDFGASRLGAILQAQQGTVPGAWTKLQGCWVKAKKTATTVGKQTWMVYHMATQAPHAPF